MQNYSPATISTFTGLSYTIYRELKSNFNINQEYCFVGNFYGYLSEKDYIYYLAFGYIDTNQQLSDITMVPLVKIAGTHAFPVKDKDITEYLYNFLEHKTEYTFDALLGNKVSETISINNRIRTYCEMISEDCSSIKKIIMKIHRKGQLPIGHDL